MTAAVVALNSAAKVALADCEQRIERGLKTFIDVGQALAEIRDSRLYKGTHNTFEEYLEQRWQMSRSYAHRMIAAAEVALPIGNAGLPTPSTESQARELAKMPEAERADAWRTAVERTGKPTAAVVKQVAEDRAAPDEQVQRRCFGCHHIFTSGADNGCPKCGGFGIRYKTPESDGAVTAPPADPGLESATPTPARTAPASAVEALKQAKRVAEQRDARALLSRVIDILTPSPGFVDTWLSQLGALDDELTDLVKRAADAHALLGDLIERARR